MALTMDDIVPAIRQTIQEVIIEELSARLDKMEKNISELAQLKDILSNQENRLEACEKSLEFSGNQLHQLKNETIPKLDDKITELTTKICMNMLDIDMHRRKWSLTLNGLEGEPGENEVRTRATVKSFAKDKLKVPGADSHLISACHRLSQSKDAGIIVRFGDLKDRNCWLQNAKNLQNTNSGVSISPDLPPALRPLKADILKQRKSLTPNQKKLSKVKYLPSWPYVSLKVQNNPTQIPRIRKEDIVLAYLDHTKLSIQ